jgi:TetR/AcrR family fatty acid metabolism transcriptional regulator
VVADAGDDPQIETEADPVREQLRKVVALVLRTWNRDPDLVRVLVREVTRTPHLQTEVAEIQHAFDALERIIARGQEAGEFRREIDPRVAGWSLYGALEEILTGWVMGQLRGEEADVARAERTVVELFCRGLDA